MLCWRWMFLIWLLCHFQSLNVYCCCILPLSALACQITVLYLRQYMVLLFVKQHLPYFTGVFFTTNIYSLEQPIKKCRMDRDTYSHRSGSQQANNMPSVQKRPREKSPPQPQYDPYEFSDDSSSDPGNFSNRSFRNSRDENFARSSPFGNKQVSDGFLLCMHELLMPYLWWIFMSSLV